MTEVALWDALRPKLQSLDPVRVENGIMNSTPDVNYTKGWIELKDHPLFPKSAQTKVNIPKLQDEHGGQQVAWLTRRWCAKGLAWLWVRVGGTHYLFDGYTSRYVRKGLNPIEFNIAAMWRSASLGEEYIKRLLPILDGNPSEMLAHDRAKYYRLVCCKTTMQVAAELGRHYSAIEYAEMGYEHTGGSNLVDELIEYWEA